MIDTPDCNIEIGSKVQPDPAVSIIIPNYKTAAYIAETLESVFAQEFKNFEVIVINDGAPDSEELYKAIEAYRDRIVFIDKSFNEGTSATRNRAAKYARGNVLAFLDADDIWQPSFLSELYEFLNQTGFDMVYADLATFISGSRRLTNLLQVNPPQGEITRELLIDGKCLILPSGSVIRRSAFEAVGGFDPMVARTEDFDLWMRMLFAGIRIGHLRKILFHFRISPGSGSGDAVVRLERCITCWRALQNKLGFTEAENAKIEWHVGDYEAAIMRVRGRDAIMRKNWNEARIHLSDAKTKAAELGLPLSHQIKLSAILTFLGIAPSLTRAAYATFRSKEIDFLPSSLGQG